MHRRLWVAGGSLLAVCGIALTAGGAYAYYFDSTRTDVIAVGVRIAGIDVGGLHAAEARQLVETRLAQRLSEPVHIGYGSRRFTVHPTQAGLHVDVAKMVDAAVQTSRSGGLAHRFFRDVGGQPLRKTIPLLGAVSRPHLETIVDQVARVIDRPAHNARVQPNALATGLHIVPSRPGLAVKRPMLERALTSALLSFDGHRTIAIPTRSVAPRWWTSTLTRHYGTYILVSRETFTLRLYKNLKLAKTYRIAVGRAGLETPAGEYTINDKQINPSWHVPLSSWAGALAGRIIPPGPDDPIKSRWLGFFDGAGIHGTVDTWSIGTAASHGCIRMTIPDVEDLYPRVPLHSPIYVG
jgi:L,D-transpeptidase catalytic domain/Putative peptidoglycan binding domain